jgi:predicted alpha-1,2-mannosidase
MRIGWLWAGTNSATILCLAVFFGCWGEPPTKPVQPYDPLPWVDPMIGTGGDVYEVVGLNPGATLPFGMTQTGPQTSDANGHAFGLFHFGGYHYPDRFISGFAHEHANGMGANDFGGIVVMPRGGRQDYTTPGARAAPFEHRAERATPGVYSVTLDDDGTQVAIAATLRGAIHRYRFAPGTEPSIWLDLGHHIGSVSIGAATVRIDAEAGTIDAFQQLHGSYSGRFGGLQTWARLAVEPAPVSAGTWSDPDHPEPGRSEAQGPQAGAWLRFAPGTDEVVLRVALSHVDEAGAHSNFEAELAGRSFDVVQAEGEAHWREVLGGVRVRGGSDEQRTIFHTALYHAYLWPNRFQDVDGRYRGIDGAIHHADFNYHSNFSMWDTFRTTHPWFILARPDDQRAMVKSLLRMVVDGGVLPRWALGHGYTGGMVGTPAAQILAETALKGIEGWDQQAGFSAALRAATEPVEHAGRQGLTHYLSEGFVPIEAGGGNASLTLEYSWNDHALGLWAAQLGESHWAETLRGRGLNWRNHWDENQRFVVGRFEGGSFRALSSPEQWTDDYIEGNAWHYLWPVPYDVEGIVELQHGGNRGAFLARYTDYWAKVAAEPDDVLPDDYYWHGNEPDLHYPWLGALLNHPEASIGPVRHVMASRYNTSPAGLDGNDDAGTLSSWYLFAALGLYPVAGTPTYALTSPIFERVEIDHPKGTLVIEAAGTSEAAVLPEAIYIGDEKLIGSTLDHARLMTAKRLRFSYP